MAGGRGKRGRRARANPFQREHRACRIRYAPYTDQRVWQRRVVGPLERALAERELFESKTALDGGAREHLARQPGGVDVVVRVKVPEPPGGVIRQVVAFEGVRPEHARARRDG